MKTYDYMLLENMLEDVCLDREHWRTSFQALNEMLRTTCEELDETKLLLKQLEAEVLALRAENARLIAAAPKLLEFVQEWLNRQGTDANYMTAKAREVITEATGESE